MLFQKMSKQTTETAPSLGDKPGFAIAIAPSATSAICHHYNHQSECPWQPAWLQEHLHRTGLANLISICDGYRGVLSIPPPAPACKAFRLYAALGTKPIFCTGSTPQIAVIALDAQDLPGPGFAWFQPSHWQSPLAIAPTQACNYITQADTKESPNILAN